MKTKFIIGTRGSALALAQARHFAAELQRAHPGVVLEEKIIKTRGDQRLDVRLAGTGPLDKGLFTRELETALHDGAIDCAVHSLKDLPVEMPEGFELGAVLPREDPADVLILKKSRKLNRIATSSPRRALQLGLEHPDLEVREIRGNVPTRLRKLLEDDALDGIVLALAGLKRLGLCEVCNGSARWQGGEFSGLDLLILEQMLPAPGQGAVAVQTRAAESSVLELLQEVHCPDTALCVHTERALLTELGGGCHLALGARAEIEPTSQHGQVVRLRAVFFPQEHSGLPLRGEAVAPVNTPDVSRLLAAQIKTQWINQ